MSESENIPLPFLAPELAPLADLTAIAEILQRDSISQIAAAKIAA